MKTMSSWIRTIVAACIVTLSALSVTEAEEAYTAPTDEQVAEIAENPELLRNFIDTASVDQSADLLVRVLSKLETLDTTWSAKQAATGEFFSIVYETKGAQAEDIVARVRKKVNPRLLPVIRVGDGVGPAVPPNLPRYPRQ